MTIFVSVDVGGTFTDLLAFDSEQGLLLSAKSLTTPDDPTRGIIDCLRKANVDLGRTGQVKHGTTLAINTALERTGARTALLTTKGFRDTLEIGRGNRPEGYNVLYQRLPPIVPREDRYEVAERMNANGTVAQAMDAEAVEGVARELIERGVEAVAVCFLNSYRNPAHEEAAAAILRQFPLFVSASTEISREWREFERTSTAVLNAYVGPRCRSYLATLDTFLSDHKFQGQFLLMQSNGGLMGAEVAATRPVFLLESGPVAGVTGAGAIGQILGLNNIISFDMGGTTAKTALVESGNPTYSSTYYVAGYNTGYPVQIDVVDIVEVGAGGGSIAWLDQTGFMKVGPRSAGSAPGPACYGLGGAHPTITDANLVLGRLNPKGLKGVELKLDKELALSSLQNDLAAPLGKTPEEIAAGIIEIANVTMSIAVRKISIERGRDPRDFAMVAMGGAGPLHATAIARELNIPTVIFPPLPGHFSALGMLLSDPRYDRTLTLLAPIDSVDLAQMEQSLQEMSEDAIAQLQRDVPAVSAISVQRYADLRYVGQYHTVRISLPAPGEAVKSGEMASSFHKVYKQRYGHADDKARVEIVSLRTVVDGSLPKPDLFHTQFAEPAVEAGEPGKRRVYFESVREFREAAIYQRDALRPGAKVEGPAIVEEIGSTCVLQPGDIGVVERAGLLVVSIGGGGSSL